VFSLLLALENPLAVAVDAYWSGEASQLAFQELHEQQPEDPERRYWLARSYLDAGRCGEAVDLLEGRVGEGPDWRLRMVEGLAAMCVDQPERAWNNLVVAAPEMTPDPLREQAWAVLGLLAAMRGEPAARWLHQAGGDPHRVLPSRLAQHLEDRVLGAVCVGEGSLGFDYDGLFWSLDLASCLARPAPRPVQAPCDAEATPTGVRRDGELVLMTRPGFHFEQPRCDGESLWVLRRGPDGDVLQRDQEVVDTGGVAIATYDVGPQGPLLVVVDGGPQLWRVGEDGPVRLIDTPLPLLNAVWLD